MAELKALLEAAGWTTSISCNLGCTRTSIHRLGFCLDFLICGGSFLVSGLLPEGNNQIPLIYGVSYCGYHPL